MSTKNKKSTMAQALLEMDDITNAIKEESKKSLNVLLSEAVKNALREGCDEESDDEYEVVDDEKNDAVDAEVDSNSESQETEDESVSDEESIESDNTEEIDSVQDAPEEGEDEESWSEFSKYQVGDDTYDLTGENDYENVVKVYKLLKDEDQVVVKQDGNKIQLKDDSVGTEYVIDLGGDGETPEVENSEDDFDSLQESILGPDDPDFWPKGVPRVPRDEWDMMGNNAKEIEMSDNSEDDDIAGFEGDEEELISTGAEPSNSEIARASRGIEFGDDDLNIDSLLDDEDDFLYESIKNNRNKKTRKPMKESKEVLFEVDLGYTDNYQDKDPIAGLSNNEPSKSGKSWHKGVPTGTAKPWAGETKSKGEPFEKTINEEGDLEEMQLNEVAIAPILLSVLPMIIQNLPEIMKASPQFLTAVQNFMRTQPGFMKPMEEGAMSVSSQSMGKETKTKTSEPRRNNARQVSKNVSTAQHGYEEIVNENKKLKAQNKALKETLVALKGNLSEAYVTNVNLGKITKLFLENTTSQAEKVDIVNRFSNEAKTVEQSNALYESIKRELNKSMSTQMNINESMSKAGATSVNENVYKSKDLLKTIDLMNRMGC